MAINYTKVNFQNRDDIYPNKYLVDGEAKEIVKDDSGLNTAGTLLNAVNLDKLDQGLKDASDNIDTIETNVSENANNIANIDEIVNVPNVSNSIVSTKRLFNIGKGDSSELATEAINSLVDIKIKGVNPRVNVFTNSMLKAPVTQWQVGSAVSITPTSKGFTLSQSGGGNTPNDVDHVVYRDLDPTHEYYVSIDFRLVASQMVFFLYGYTIGDTPTSLFFSAGSNHEFVHTNKSFKVTNKPGIYISTAEAYPGTIINLVAIDITANGLESLTNDELEAYAKTINKEDGFQFDDGLEVISTNSNLIEVDKFQLYDELQKLTVSDSVNRLTINSANTDTDILALMPISLAQGEYKMSFNSLDTINKEVCLFDKELNTLYSFDSDTAGMKFATIDSGDITDFSEVKFIGLKSFAKLESIIFDKLTLSYDDNDSLLVASKTDSNSLILSNDLKAIDDIADDNEYTRFSEVIQVASGVTLDGLPNAKYGGKYMLQYETGLVETGTISASTITENAIIFYELARPIKKDNINALKLFKSGNIRIEKRREEIKTYSASTGITLDKDIDYIESLTVIDEYGEYNVGIKGINQGEYLYYGNPEYEPPTWNWFKHPHLNDGDVVKVKYKYKSSPDVRNEIEYPLNLAQKALFDELKIANNDKILRELLKRIEVLESNL